MTISKEKHEIPPLLSPPLIETIFEVRWELQGDQQTGRYRDPSYPMMYGRLYERVKELFPVIEDLPSNQMHPEASPYVVRHWMRKEKNGYPLLQIGPGIATVNCDAKAYDWPLFKETILTLIESIIDLYPLGAPPLNFIKSELRYLNGIFVDLQKEGPLQFLAEKLHTKVEFDPEILSSNRIDSPPNAVSVNVAYPLQRPVGNLILNANLGQIEKKPAYLVQAVIDSFGETVPDSLSLFESWLEEAHDVAVNCFLAFCKGPLLEKFCTV